MLQIWDSTVSWDAVEFAECLCLVFSPSTRLMYVLLTIRRRSEKGDLQWKRETEFLSVFLADKPNIFSTFQDVLSIEESAFFIENAVRKRALI